MMHTAATFGVVVPRLDEPRVLSVRGPPTVILHGAQDHLHLADGIHEVVVARLFSAGLALQGALGLMDEHPLAGRIQEAIDDLDLTIRDYRTALFDHHQP
jgi:hypothetical protein